jgi:hypothetical protein
MIPSAACSNKLTALVEIIHKEPQFLDHIHPFNLYLMACAAPRTLLPLLKCERVQDLLDPTILTDLYQVNLPPAYWRSIYLLEYRRRHQRWSSGFRGLPQPMRRWYKHLVNVQTGQVLELDMSRFPICPTPGVMCHPSELLAAHLLLYVMARPGYVSERLHVEWPPAPSHRIIQALLHQCLRQRDHGLDLFERLRPPFTPSIMERMEGTVRGWLVAESRFYDGLSTEAIDRWLLALNVPKKWIATGLLAQGRIDTLNDKELRAVLSKFLLQDTSLKLVPRPAWVDFPRVRQMFAVIDAASGNSREWADTMRQNLQHVTSAEFRAFSDLLFDIPELGTLSAGALALTVEKMKIK